MDTIARIIVSDNYTWVDIILDAENTYCDDVKILLQAKSLDCSKYFVEDNMVIYRYMISKRIPTFEEIKEEYEHRIKEVREAINKLYEIKRYIKPILISEGLIKE